MTIGEALDTLKRYRHIFKDTDLCKALDIIIEEVEPPRLLTEDDFINSPLCDDAGGRPAWREFSDMTGAGWSIAYRFIAEGYRDHGVARRFWTKKPTVKQSLATPWKV